MKLSSSVFLFQEQTTLTLELNVSPLFISLIYYRYAKKVSPDRVKSISLKAFITFGTCDYKHFRNKKNADSPHGIIWVDNLAQ